MQAWKAATSPWSRAREVNTPAPVKVATAPQAAGRPGQRVDAADQRARDSEARAILESELKKAEARQAELVKEYNNGEPEKLGPEHRNHQKYLDRVAEMKASIARNESDIAGIRRELGRGLRQNEGLTKPAPLSTRFQAFDLLATLVAVVAGDGSVLFANSALEDALGTSRRTIEGSSFPPCFTEPQVLQNALEGARSNEFAALRYDAWLMRQSHEPMPVHVVVAQTDGPASSSSNCCRWKRRRGRTAKSG